MKNILFLLISCLVAFTGVYSQQEKQRAEQRSDTALSGGLVRQVKQQITITPQQEVALGEASVKAQQARREVFRKYWKTPQFQQEMAKAERFQDSLYEAVLGRKAYVLYREKLNRAEQKRGYEIQVRARQKRDSITTKPNQHEK